MDLYTARIYTKNKLGSKAKSPSAVAKFWKVELGESLKVQAVGKFVVFSEYIVSDYAPSQLLPDHFKWLYSCGNASAYYPVGHKPTIEDFKALEKFSKGAMFVSGNCVVLRYPNMVSVNPAYTVEVVAWDKIATYPDGEWIRHVFCARGVTPKPEAKIAGKCGLLTSDYFKKVKSYFGTDLIVGGNNYQYLGKPWSDQAMKDLESIGFERSGKVITYKDVRLTSNVIGNGAVREHMVVLDYYKDQYYLVVAFNEFKDLFEYLGAEYANKNICFVLDPKIRFSIGGKTWSVHSIDGALHMIYTPSGNIVSNEFALKRIATAQPAITKLPSICKGHLEIANNTIYCADAIEYLQGFKPAPGFKATRYTYGNIATAKGNLDYYELTAHRIDDVCTKVGPNVFVLDCKVMAKGYADILTEGTTGSILIPGGWKFTDKDIEILYSEGLCATPQGGLFIPAGRTTVYNGGFEVKFSDGARLISASGRRKSTDWEDLNTMAPLANYGKLTKVAFYIDDDKVASNVFSKTLRFTSTGFVAPGQSVQPDKKKQSTAQQPALPSIKVGKWEASISDIKDTTSVAKPSGKYLNVTDNQWNPQKLRAVLKLLVSNGLANVEGSGWSYVDSEFKEVIPFSEYYQVVGDVRYGLTPKDWATDRRVLSRLGLPNFQIVGKLGCTYHIPSPPVKYFPPPAKVTFSPFASVDLSNIVDRRRIGRYFENAFANQCSVTTSYTEMKIVLDEKVWWDDLWDDMAKQNSGFIVDKATKTITLR